MSHLHFKPTVDFSCVTALFNLVKNKELLEKRTEALDHAFFLGGSLNAWFAGDENHDPEAFGSISVPNELEGDGALIERLQEELVKAGALSEEQTQEKTQEETQQSGEITSLAPNIKVEEKEPAGKMNEVLAMLLKKLIEVILEQLL